MTLEEKIKITSKVVDNGQTSRKTRAISHKMWRNSPLNSNLLTFSNCKSIRHRAPSWIKTLPSIRGLCLMLSSAAGTILHLDCVNHHFQTNQKKKWNKQKRHYRLASSRTIKANRCLNIQMKRCRHPTNNRIQNKIVLQMIISRRLDTKLILIIGTQRQPPRWETHPMRNQN